MNLSKISLGVSHKIPFSMAFTFTKKETLVITGSVDNIYTHTKYWDPCHAMIHTYVHSGLVKFWHCLGRGQKSICAISHKRIVYPRYYYYSPRYYNSLMEYRVFNEDNSFKKLKNANLNHRRKYHILIDDKLKYVIGWWRKIPSHYLKEFDNYKAMLNENTLV